MRNDGSGGSLKAILDVASTTMAAASEAVLLLLVMADAAWADAEPAKSAVAVPTVADPALPAELSPWSMFVNADIVW